MMQISGSLYPDIVLCSSSWYRSETQSLFATQPSLCCIPALP